MMLFQTTERASNNKTTTTTVSFVEISQRLYCFFYNPSFTFAMMIEIYNIFVQQKFQFFEKKPILSWKCKTTTKSVGVTRQIIGAQLKGERCAVKI